MASSSADADTQPPKTTTEAFDEALADHEYRLSGAFLVIVNLTRRIQALEAWVVAHGLQEPRGSVGHNETRLADVMAMPGFKDNRYELE